jgi:hypothetical protein
MRLFERGVPGREILNHLYDLGESGGEEEMDDDSRIELLFNTLPIEYFNRNWSDTLVLFDDVIVLCCVHWRFVFQSTN